MKRATWHHTGRGPGKVAAYSVRPYDGIITQVVAPPQADVLGADVEAKSDEALLPEGDGFKILAHTTQAKSCTSRSILRQRGDCSRAGKRAY